jgi:hypothetical protein
MVTFAFLTSDGLGEMFEGDFADKCAKQKFRSCLVSALLCMTSFIFYKGRNWFSSDKYLKQGQGKDYLCFIL